MVEHQKPTRAARLRPQGLVKQDPAERAYLQTNSKGLPAQVSSAFEKTLVLCDFGVLWEYL